MNKKIAVGLATLAVLGGLAIPGASSKAEFVSTDPVMNALAALPSDQPYQVVPMRITAYSSSPDETDYNPFYTADGSHVHDGVIASNLFPFGTKIEIPALFGNKVFTVDDRMAKRFQKTIDIWMPSKAQALYFGVANTKVIVLSTTTLVSYNPPNSPSQVIDKSIAANIK